MCDANGKSDCQSDLRCTAGYAGLSRRFSMSPILIALPENLNQKQRPNRSPLIIFLLPSIDRVSVRLFSFFSAVSWSLAVLPTADYRREDHTVAKAYRITCGSKTPIL